jgi:CubicO group peptidase (beta-lactamase class C family)
MTRSVPRYAFLLASVLFFTLLAAGQQRVVGGPPPEIRGHVDAFVKALNSGSSDQWEKMAQEHYSPAHLKRHSAEQRKQMFENLRRDFGNISVGRVEREGPDDAPLQLYTKGSTGASGVIELELEQDAPYRINGVRVRVGGPADDGPQSSVAQPQVNGNMTSEQLAAALDSYLGKLAADDVLSGNVLIAKDGKPVYEKSHGFADRANKVPNTSATRFNLGSINKTFTQAAIQQLIARGKLSLTDTVGKLLPDYPQETTRAATVDQLLHHTGGVADFFGEEFAGAGKDRFRSNANYYKLVSSLKPLFAPGARNEYCNGCYIVLGAIIERVSGVAYEKYVEENIFKPVGMTATGPLQSDDIIPNVAMGYTHRVGDGKLRSNVLMRGAAGSAAGGGYATAADLLAYAQALRHGRIPDVPPANDIGIAGGSAGINSVLEQNGAWTVIVLTNLDPRVGEDIGRAVARALSR